MSERSSVDWFVPLMLLGLILAAAIITNSMQHATLRDRLKSLEMRIERCEGRP